MMSLLLLIGRWSFDFCWRNRQNEGRPIAVKLLINFETDSRTGNVSAEQKKLLNVNAAGILDRRSSIGIGIGPIEYRAKKLASKAVWVL